MPALPSRFARFRRFLIPGIIGIVVIIGLVNSMTPKPVEVDLGAVTRGRMMVTVDEDGQTRIKEKYEVSAPLAGRLRRIALDPGDPVKAGQTVLAIIEPNSADLLDARTKASAEARVMAATAAQEQARTNLATSEAEAEYETAELKRMEQLFKSGTATPKEMDAARLRYRQTTEKLRSSQLAQKIAQFELDQAKAALIHAQPGDRSETQFEIKSPIDGQVLRVEQESSVVVAPGTKLLEIGNPRDLEIEVDVLSTDAVKILPGNRVILEHWGGEKPLEGSVRYVEPSAFTKISALGVEEQRVWMIADLTAPEDQRKSLGDGFRVEARIVVWEKDDVLRAPMGALFRQDDDWAAFEDDQGVARLRVLKIGKMNGLEAEVLEGLSGDAKLLLHPSDKIREGTKVKSR